MDVTFIREKWNEFANKNLSHLEDDVLEEYKIQVDSGELGLFAFYRDEERVGTGIARIFRKDGHDYIEALEVGGKGLDVKSFYFPFFLAVGKALNCDRFMIGTVRKSMKKFCRECKMKQKYAEYEIDIEKALA